MNTALILSAEMIVNGIFILANFGLFISIWRLRKKGEAYYKLAQNNLEESKRLLELSRIKNNSQSDEQRTF